MVAVDEPHLGFIQNPFKLPLQRLLRLDVTQQDDCSRRMLTDCVDDVLTVTVNVARKEDFCCHNHPSSSGSLILGQHHRPDPIL